MKQQKQSGFAHLGIVVIILTVALVGLLGFIFWQNFVQKQNVTKTVSKDTSNERQNNNETNNKTDEKINSLYSGDRFSFEYPKNGWNVSEDATTNTVRIYTSDYKTGPMGLESGSTVFVGLLKPYKSAVDMVNTYKAKGMINDTKSVTIDGQVGYKFGCYEFCTYEVVFDKNGVAYEVQFSTEGGVMNSDVFDLVLSTLTIK